MMRPLHFMVVLCAFSLGTSFVRPAGAQERPEPEADSASGPQPEHPSDPDVADDSGSAEEEEAGVVEGEATGDGAAHEREQLAGDSATEDEGEERHAETVEEEAAEDAEPLGGDEAQRAEAREHLSRGRELYADEDWDGALAEFQRAYEVLVGHPSRPLLLYNIGQCHEHLFHYGRAMDCYRRYLEMTGPEVEGREEVEGKVELLEGLLATIHLEVNVPEYEVWVDERRIGVSLSEVAVPGGTHVIQLRAEGYDPAQQEIQLPAQAERRLSFELEREYRGVHQGYFWASAGVAVAALAAGVAFGVRFMNEHDRVSSQSQHPAERWLLTQDEVDRVSQLALTADILYATAGLFAVTAAVLAFLTDWGREQREGAEDEGGEASRSGLVAGWGPDAVSVGVRGVF